MARVYLHVTALFLPPLPAPSSCPLFLPPSHALGPSEVSGLPVQTSPRPTCATQSEVYHAQTWPWPLRLPPRVCLTQSTALVPARGGAAQV